MGTVEMKNLEELEDKALRKAEYPLPLEDRERRFQEMAELQLSAAGVRQLQISAGSSIWVALKADGVGTKILIAEAMQIYNTIGIDAVAMTANDILCVGAKPIMLVDYLAQNQENNAIHKEIIEGVEKGCEMADVMLVGGETATLSSMINGYGDKYHFDLATTCFGVFKDSRGPMTGKEIADGDIVVGLASSGLHSNGFLWVRPLLLKEFNRNAPYTLYDKTPSGDLLGEELLKPTAIYVEPVIKMIDELEIKAISHITGGAFKIKLPRLASQGISFVLDKIPEPPWIFEEIKRQAKCAYNKLYEAFNMGIGMCIVVHEKKADDAINIAEEHGFKATRIGYAKKDDESRVYIPSKNVVYSKVQ